MKNIKALPSQSYLRSVLDYDPRTGILTWRARDISFFSSKRGWRCFQRYIGKVAGTASAEGYMSVGVHGRYYKSHRIIWKWMTGTDPGEVIDHKDGNGLNNRWNNLRLADGQRNLWNAKLRAESASGRRGVYYCKWRRNKPWRARIQTKNGGDRHLGCFATRDEAYDAWKAAAKSQRGEFFRAS